MKYTYESKLAPYITGLIEQKQTDGFSYDSGEALLKRFDRFCLSRYPDATTVTFELAAEWTAALPDTQTDDRYFVVDMRPTKPLEFRMFL